MEKINKKLDTIIKLLEKLTYPAVTIQQPATYQCAICHAIIASGTAHICCGTILSGGIHKS